MLRNETVRRCGIFYHLKTLMNYYLERFGIGPCGEPRPTPIVGMTKRDISNINLSRYDKISSIN